MKSFQKYMYKETNLVILNSGGTTPVINSTIYGCIDQAKKSKLFDNIFISLFGVDGLILNKFLNVKKLKINKLKKLKLTPGSAFGISRNPRISKINFEKINKNLIKKRITHLINIGGNGSLEQTLTFKKKVKSLESIGFAPKTVDNDLGDKDFKKVFFTPGFPTCINFWVRILNYINIENIAARNHDKVIVCQTFGRDTGHITAATKMFDLKSRLPILYLFPEIKQTRLQILKRIKFFIKKFGRAIVIIGEGYDLGNFKVYRDQFGQAMFGSSSSSVAQILVNFLIDNKIQARYFLPTILQRVNSFSYLKKDNEVAEKLGRNCIKQFQKKKTDFMCTLSKDKKKFSYSTLDLNNCLNFKRKLDKTNISKKNFDVSRKYISYLKDIKNFTNIDIGNNLKKNFFEYEKI